MIIGDRQRGTQAIVQPAHNAAPHTDDGDEIAIGSSLQHGRRGCGCATLVLGVPLDEQQRIFERFAGAGGERRAPEFAERRCFGANNLLLESG